MGTHRPWSVPQKYHRWRTGTSCFHSRRSPSPHGSGCSGSRGPPLPSYRSHRGSRPHAWIGVFLWGKERTDVITTHPLRAWRVEEGQETRQGAPYWRGRTGLKYAQIQTHCLKQMVIIPFLNKLFCRWYDRQRDSTRISLQQTHKILCLPIPLAVMHEVVHCKRKSSVVRHKHSQCQQEETRLPAHPGKAGFTCNTGRPLHVRRCYPQVTPSGTR